MLAFDEQTQNTITVKLLLDISGVLPVSINYQPGV